MTFPNKLTASNVSPKLSVLVVDDNEANAKVTGLIVEMLGHHARTAGSGKEALEIVTEFTPDIVVLDIGLPQMNGYELCKALKQDPKLSSTIFIAQTGWDREEDKLKSKEAGFDHHWVKPVDIQNFEKIFAERQQS